MGEYTAPTSISTTSGSRVVVSDRTETEIVATTIIRVSESLQSSGSTESLPVHPWGRMAGTKGDGDPNGKGFVLKRGLKTTGFCLHWYTEPVAVVPKTLKVVAMSSGLGYSPWATWGQAVEMGKGGSLLRQLA